MSNQLVSAALARFKAAIASVTGPSFMGWLRSGVGAVATTLANWMEWRSVNLFEFFTPAQIADAKAGTLLVDTAAAIQAAIDSMEARGGGVIKVPPALCLALSPIYGKRGVKLKGSGARKPGGVLNGVSGFVGRHTGAAVLSLKGAHCCEVEDILLYGDATVTPKTGLCLGRNSAASAGLHTIKNVNVEGYFSKAGVYSIASESNIWIHPTITVMGGGAIYGFYSSQGDDLAVDGLTGSSNLENKVIGAEVILAANNPGASGIFLSSGASTGAWSFDGCYSIVYSGSYYTVQSGASDGLDTIGSITFHGCGGEIYNQAGGGAPQQGFNLIGTQAISGLTIIGGRFQFANATGNERTIKQAATLTLKQPFIAIQAMANAIAELKFDKIADGYVRAGAQSFTAPALTNTWDFAYAQANGIETPGYYRDPNGIVHLRGVISNGVIASPCFQLPAGYRPSGREMFAVLSNGAIGRFDVFPDGQCVLQAGSNVYASLSGISFRAA